MLPSTNPTEDLAVRRRRVRYRAWHRGIKEMDLVLGRFSDAYVENFDSDMLDRLEILMDEQDADLLSWVLEQVPAPKTVDQELLTRLRDHQRGFAASQR